MNTIHPEAMATESDVVDVTPEFDAQNIEKDN